MATYNEVLNALKAGKKAKRKDWPDCRFIRMSKETDNDLFFNDVDLGGKIMEDCKKVCDCNISIWNKHPLDVEATDWEILEA